MKDGEKLIYENIRRLCKERGISVAQLEEKAGLKPGIAHRWKHSMPGADKLKAVADCLGVNMETLLGLEDRGTPMGVIRLVVNGEAVLRDSFRDNSDLSRKIMGYCRGCTECTVTIEIE